MTPWTTLRTVCLVGVLLGGACFAPPLRAQDVEEAEEPEDAEEAGEAEALVFVAQGQEDAMRQHFLEAARRMIQREVHFLRQVCHPTRSQYSGLETAAEKTAEEVAADQMKAMTNPVRGLLLGPGRPESRDYREIVRGRLGVAVETHMSRFHAARYRREHEEREEQRREAIAARMVAAVDRRLNLRAEQRERLVIHLLGSWPPAMENLHASAEFHLMPREAARIGKRFERVLDDGQLPIWRALAHDPHPQFSSIRMAMFDVGLDEDEWQEFAPEESAPGAATGEAAAEVQAAGMDNLQWFLWIRVQGKVMPLQFLADNTGSSEIDPLDSYVYRTWPDITVALAKGSCTENWQTAVTTLLDLRIAEVSALAPLDDGGKQKLVLAAHGEMERVLAELAAARTRVEPATDEESNPFREVDIPELNPSRLAMADVLYDENGFFQKAVAGTLSGAALAEYQKREAERRAFHRRAVVASGVLCLGDCLHLLADQTERLTALLVEAVTPLRQCDEYDDIVVLAALSRIPEEELKAVFDAPQWRRLSKLMVSIQAQAEHLGQGGFVTAAALLRPQPEPRKERP